MVLFANRLIGYTASRKRIGGPCRAFPPNDQHRWGSRASRYPLGGMGAKPRLDSEKNASYCAPGGAAGGCGGDDVFSFVTVAAAGLPFFLRNSNVATTAPIMIAAISAKRGIP